MDKIYIGRKHDQWRGKPIYVEDEIDENGFNDYGIYKIMNNNPQLMKKIIAYLRQIAKARHESHKIKGVSVKKTTSFLEDAEISKYFTVSNRNSTGYKELFLCEGD